MLPETTVRFVRNYKPKQWTIEVHMLGQILSKVEHDGADACGALERLASKFIIGGVIEELRLYKGNSLYGYAAAPVSQPKAIVEWPGRPSAVPGPRPQYGAFGQLMELPVDRSGKGKNIKHHAIVVLTGNEVELEL